jgi:hypothetical protein
MFVEKCLSTEVTMNLLLHIEFATFIAKILTHLYL